MATARIGLPKSGQKRRVGLSRRLRKLFLARFLAAGGPALDQRIVKAPWPQQFCEALLEACKTARIAAHTSKNFRDTFASVLVTHGINLTWVSRQLGHGSVRTTEKHYARYMEEEGYRNPSQVQAGELPNDLFARLDGWNPAGCQQSASKLPARKRK